MDHPRYLAFVLGFDWQTVAAIAHSDHPVLEITSRATVEQTVHLAVDAVIGRPHISAHLF